MAWHAGLSIRSPDGRSPGSSSSSSHAQYDEPTEPSFHYRRGSVAGYWRHNRRESPHRSTAGSGTDMGSAEPGLGFLGGLIKFQAVTRRVLVVRDARRRGSQSHQERMRRERAIADYFTTVFSDGSLRTKCCTRRCPRVALTATPGGSSLCCYLCRQSNGRRHSTTCNRSGAEAFEALERNPRARQHPDPAPQSSLLLRLRALNSSTAAPALPQANAAGARIRRTVRNWVEYEDQFQSDDSSVTEEDLMARALSKLDERRRIHTSNRADHCDSDRTDHRFGTGTGASAVAGAGATTHGHSTATTNVSGRDGDGTSYARAQLKRR